MTINLSRYNRQALEDGVELPAEVFDALVNNSKAFLPRAADKPSITTKFSHDLVRTGENAWHGIDKVQLAKGGFGSVHPSVIKIVLRDNKAFLYSCDDIVKIQLYKSGFTKEAYLQRIITEAKHQKEHRIQVHAVVPTDEAIYIVMENRGQSLADLLPFVGDEFTFDFRVRLLFGISNELLLLQQRGKIHRDLKAENICCKIDASDKLVVSLIDFGIADYEDGQRNSEGTGTDAFFAPEGEIKTVSGSDRWAFGPIMGEILSAPNVMLYRQAAKELFDKGEISKYTYLSTPYCYEGLFEGITIPTDVDSLLLEDFKRLAESLNDYTAENRPSVEFINKFLLAIPYRRRAYRRFQKKFSQLQHVIKELSNVYLDLKEVDQSQLTAFKRNITAREYDSQAFDATQQRLEQSLFHSMRTLQTQTLSHYDITTKLLEDNQPTFDYRDFFPNLDAVLNNATQLLRHNNEKIIAFNNSLSGYMAGTRFANTNSSGLIEIQQILDSSKTPLEKLTDMSLVAKRKTSHNCAHWYSQSHFFGKGRHSNVELLYEKLARIDLSKPSLKQDLTDIEEFVENTTFTHSK